MKSYIFIIVFVSIIINVGMTQSPECIWAKSAGEAWDDIITASVMDDAGNLYVSGTFQGADFPFDSCFFQHIWLHDILVAKLNKNGKVVWARSFGGSGCDHCQGICTDINGGLFVTGYFNSNNLVFGNDTLAAQQ